MPLRIQHFTHCVPTENGTFPRDGNGRASRILTTLVLLQNGYHVGRFISLERIVEEHKEEYYSVLHKSSQKWHDKKSNPFPWIMFFVSTLRQAYNELADKVKQSPDASDFGAKTEIIRGVVQGQLSRFTLSDIVGLCPTLNIHLIKKVLTQLKSDGIITLEGRGRGAHWKRNT